MKKAADLSHLLSRDALWLRWWQELILNWVSGWETIESLTVVSAADPDLFMVWDLQSDVDMDRLKLEELLDMPSK